MDYLDHWYFEQLLTGCLLFHTFPCLTLMKYCVFYHTNDDIFTHTHTQTPARAKQTRANQTRFDIMHYHIDTTDTPKQEPWAKARELYKDVMRDPENINFITIFREPRDRLLSFYTFYVEFITSVSEESVQGSSMDVCTINAREDYSCACRNQFFCFDKTSACGDCWCACRNGAILDDTMFPSPA